MENRIFAFINKENCYYKENVITVADTAGINAAQEMADFVQHIRDVAQAINPDFLVIAQNAADLCDDHPEYYTIIDAVAQEDLSFLGETDVPWETPMQAIYSPACMPFDLKTETRQSSKKSCL